MKVGKRVALAVLGVFLGLLLAFMAITAYAYFSKKEIYDGYFSGEVELLFDRLNEEGMAAYGAENTGITVSSDAEWGSAEYPYVISNVRHLYNLAELQRLGYFYKKHIIQNADGTYSNIPHFLVCTPDYRPVLIDGTNFRGITSIGTDQYPFIGSVCGVKNTAAPITINTSKTCDTSAICNIKVSGNPANADVGLFGFVGYLGDESTVDEQTNTFSGQISTLSQLVLIDVQVTVRSSLWDEVLSFLADIAADAVNGHRFSFSELYGDNDNYNKVPHENHHIGILAGHASYAAIEYISVYYSADDVVAMDLSDQTEVDGVNANYLSATGILGFIYNINPTIVDGPDGQTITAGSGDSYSNLSYSQVGGGGTSSGTKAGYVLAVEMYQKYCYTKNEDNTLTQDTDGTIYLKDAVSADGKALCTEWIRDRILWGTEATGRYYFYDGVFTFALSDEADVIEPTWKIVTDENGDPILDENGDYTYTVDTFSIGPDDPQKWRANTEKGNKAAVAYVKEIKSLDELVEQNGNDIFILGKNADGSVFLMTLFEESTSNFNLWNSSTWGDNNYTTSGMKKNFATQEMVLSLITSIEAGNEETPSLYDGMTDDLRNETLKVINLGTADDLASLQTQYKINVASQGNDSFTFSTTGNNSKTNYLGMIVRNVRFIVQIGIYYNIYCGNTYTDFSAHNETAMLTYSGNDTDPYFSFRFEATYNSTTYSRYVSYDSTNSRFTSASDMSDSTKLYLYSIVGMSNIDFGKITFDPIDDTTSDTDCYTFRADETVLFATPTHTKDANGNISGTSTAYTVMSLEDLGWNNGLGNVVSSADLQSKFRMIKGIDFGASINIFNGTLGTTGIVTAPVGSEGVKANIPQSCIAFRINKADSDNKIRVIVSVPVSEFYPGEDGYDLGDYTRYFNLWKMEAAGESNVQVFDATGENLLDRFAVPRSHPYQPGMTPSDPASEYITASYGDSEYRCYLNGDRVLIAYEFTLDTTVDGYGVGVFCLGMSGIDAGGNVVEDVPMEIVYFSADGVASAGRDGQSGSQIGTIDFVYDYNGNIITVEEYSETGENGENYATFYPSYCLLHFDLSQQASGSTEATPIFVPVNNEQVCVRRYVIGESDAPASDENHTTTPSRSTMKAILGGDGHVAISQYSRYADNVIIQ